MQAIALSSPLPALTEPVVIDGTSQPGWSSAPLIIIDGNALGSGDGLTLTGGSSVTALVICNFPGAGIRISSGHDNIITNSYIGTDASGNGAQPNGTGIAVQTSNNVIGYPEARNVISGNEGSGIMLQGGVNTVQANYIGVKASGGDDLGNGGGGVFAQGADNLIGGLQAGEGNVISGNNTGGIELNFADRTSVVGNMIGTNAGGSASIGNGGTGVGINSAADVVIGGTQIEAANVISGNETGVHVTDASGVKNYGNRIGTSLDGNAAIPNVHEGVRIISSTGTEVGNNQDGAQRHVRQRRLRRLDQSSSDSVIQNNAIGASAGLGALPNSAGIVVICSEGDTHGNLIGGANFNALATSSRSTAASG